jgi:hypothetical protein
MIQQRRRALWFVAAAATAAVFGITSAGAEEAKLNLSNKWRISCSEGSHNDGTIVFRVTPKDGTPTEVTVNIKKGRGENGIATDISNAFKAALDKKAFHAETDDGEDVLVKKRGGAPDFELVLVQSTLEGPRFHVKKE